MKRMEQYQVRVISIAITPVCHLANQAQINLPATAFGAKRPHPIGIQEAAPETERFSEIVGTNRDTLVVSSFFALNPAQVNA